MTKTTPHETNERIGNNMIDSREGTMTLYGLMAFGTFELCGLDRQIPSRRLYGTREAAEADIDNFIELVCSPADFDLDCFTRDSVECEVFEYELDAASYRLTCGELK